MTDQPANNMSLASRAIDWSFLRRGVFAGSIAMSWMWGLGLFFSVHFTFAYGWVGLLSFAVPNALGLVVFGLLLDRRARDGDLRALAETAFAKYPLVFAFYQVAAVALTLFALIAYFLAPLGLTYAAFGGLAVLAVGLLVGEVFGIRRLVSLQAASLVAAVLAATVLLLTGPRHAAVPHEALGLPFAGFVVPLTIGLLLGPFFDIQQWQRAVEQQRQGVSVAQSFALGGLAFFLLLLVNGALAMTLTGGLEASAFTGADGILHAQPAITAALSGPGGAALFLYGIWVLLCVLTTFDSAQAGLSWFVPSVSKSSNNALLAMLPPGLLTSTLPLLGIAAVIGLAAWYAGGRLEYFMILYASLFVAYSANLAYDLYRGTEFRTLSPITLFCGLVSMLIISVGYFETAPLLMMVGSLIALFPLGLEAAGDAGAKLPKPGATRAKDRAAGKPERGSPSGRDMAVLERAAAAGPVVDAPVAAAADHALVTGSHDGRFDGKWFEVKLTATYSDTNSVGNIYFANYVAWVGKTRELFFRNCMPGFDLKQTPFYILTRSFTHKFIREAKEFDEIVVRLKIGKFNRKFVHLEHKLFDGAQNLLGEGEQSLMFVHSDDYSLIDIPNDVVTAFTPHV